jgi:hypothetical protein
MGGYVYGGDPRRRFYRVRQFLCILAGPLANAALAVTSWQLVLLLRSPLIQEQLPTGPLRLFGTPQFWGPLALFAVTNLLLLSWDFWPFPTTISGHRVWSDFISLLYTFFIPEKTIRQNYAVYCYSEGYTCFLKRRYAEALMWYRRGLTLSPDAVYCSYGVGSALFRLGQFQEAREHWLSLLKREDLPSMYLAITLDGVATADILLLLESGKDPSLLEEAARFCATAWPLSSDHAEIRLSLKGTCGVVLIEGGKVREGSALLEEVRVECMEDQVRVWCACYLALAASHQGDQEKCARYLEEAQRLKSSCLVMPGVMRRLKTVQDQSPSSPPSPATQFGV